MRRWICVVLLMAVGASTGWAGVYCSQETLAELPAQWRGFLLDQRLLRQAAIPPQAGKATNPVRLRYQREVETLRKAIGDSKPSADQAADLGALHLRLGETNKALEVLSPAQREHPEHFRLTANLATALQLAGELTRSREIQRDAARLAPPKYRGAEELHLRLLDLRLREQARGQKNVTSLDDLFGIKYQAADGSYQPGDLDPVERKKLPADAATRLQLLALALPFDTRLLWQLGELAAVHSDIVVAASILDGCVTEFNWPDPLLRDHRRRMRAVADERLKAGQGRVEHQGHHKLETRSSRPLLTQIDLVPPPPIDPKGNNPLSWFTVTQTIIDPHLKPTFPQRLKDLDGLEVTLTGYMQPLGDDFECAAFLLIEFPVGCWFCETPGLNGLMMIEMPQGQLQTFTREPITVTGRLKLNRTDRENFLFQIGPARIKAGE